MVSNVEWCRDRISFRIFIPNADWIIHFLLRRKSFVSNIVRFFAVKVYKKNKGKRQYLVKEDVWINWLFAILKPNISLKTLSIIIIITVSM